MQMLLVKIVIGVLVAGGLVTGAYIKGLKDQPEVKVSCPPCPVQECPPALGNELQKVKGKYITLQLTNTQYMSVNGDSLAFVKLVNDLRQAVKEELQESGRKRR